MTTYTSADGMHTFLTVSTLVSGHWELARYCIQVLALGHSVSSVEVFHIFFGTAEVPNHEYVAQWENCAEGAKPEMSAFPPRCPRNGTCREGS